jgi:hypothetical protein
MNFINRYWGALKRCTLISFQKADQKVLKPAHGLDVNHSVHLAMVQLGKDLNQISGGKLRVDIYPNQQPGMDPIHIGIVGVLNFCIGLCTPPLGSVLFAGISVANTSIDKVTNPLLPLFIVMVVVLILVTYIPELSRWLPSRIDV